MTEKKSILINALGDWQTAGMYFVDVSVALKQNCRIAIRQFSANVPISYGSYHSIIITEDLGMRRVYAKFGSKVLSTDQRDTQVSVVQYFIECIKNDHIFLKTLRRRLGEV